MLLFWGAVSLSLSHRGGKVLRFYLLFQCLQVNYGCFPLRDCLFPTNHAVDANAADFHSINFESEIINQSKIYPQMDPREIRILPAFFFFLMRDIPSQFAPPDQILLVI